MCKIFLKHVTLPINCRSILDLRSESKNPGQITVNYTKEDLIGTLILAVVNFPPRQIGPTISEVLTLGVNDAQGNVVLIKPDSDVLIGSRLYSFCCHRSGYEPVLQKVSISSPPKLLSSHFQYLLWPCSNRECCCKFARTDTCNLHRVWCQHRS